MQKETISITFGDQAINHDGMEKIGKLAESGLNLTDCTQILKEKNIDYELIKLHKYLPDNVSSKGLKAYLVIIRNGVNIMLNDIDGESKMLE